MRARALLGEVSRATAFTLLVVSCSAPLPAVVREEMARSPPGTATVVFFTDLQCPYCRRTHQSLASVVRARSVRVHVVYKHVPLPSHPDALLAARAAVCGERLGGSNDLADALMTSPDLGQRAITALAEARGIGRAALARCVGDRATQARIERDVEAFNALGGDGVPLLFVGRRRLEGAQSRAALESAVDAALAEAR
jgi:protein-disulfide isomerase